MKHPVVIPYVKSGDGGQELRYALRSLKNIKNWNGEVFIIGDTEKWFKDIIWLPCSRKFGQPYYEQTLKMRVACNYPNMPDWFISSMDDVYITEPVDISVYQKGDLKGVTKNFYQLTKDYTARSLIDITPVPIDFEVHAPMLVNKIDLLASISRIVNDKHPMKLQWRSVYGNMYHKGAKYYEDYKTKTSELKKASMISTQKYTEELDNLFPDKSRFEND